MTTNYPGALDTTTQLKNNAVDATVTANTHAGAHNNIADAIIAIQTELGTNPSGSFSDVTARLAGMVLKTPGADQTIQPTSDYIALGLRAFSGQTVDLFQIKDDGGSVTLTWDELAGIDADSFAVGGSPLSSTHLADTADILKNPSPSITTPSISSPTFTGTPTAPTPVVDDNDTSVATTAYVIGQGYAKPASPAFTGTPTAPTPSLSDDSTKIATTAYVVDKIDDLQESGVPLGAVILWTNATNPVGWLKCDGAAISRTTYADLFAVIGTTYGSGDGSTTFNLPGGTEGRYIVGKGTHADVDSLGENDGHSAANRTPSHGHSQSFSGDSQGSHTHSGSLTSTGSHTHGTTGTSGQSNYGSGACPCCSNTAGTTTSSDGSHSHSGSTDGEGGPGHSISGSIGSSGMTDMTPYLTYYFVIKAL